jgi:thioredoxin-dependent peroxiredoxin
MMSAQTTWKSVCCVATVAVVAVAFAADPARPEVGKVAADFELNDLQGTKHSLGETAKKGPVVLMILRGFPGYQCPVCNKQVGQYLSAAEKFKAKGATVLMVYPGPSKGLQEHAAEFVSGKTLPAGFHLLIDPDYTFTNAYDLRWDAKNETAYPSTFVLGKDRKVLFAKISKSHGDRADAADVIKAIP